MRMSKGKFSLVIIAVQHAVDVPWIGIVPVLGLYPVVHVVPGPGVRLGRYDAGVRCDY